MACRATSPRRNNAFLEENDSIRPGYWTARPGPGQAVPGLPGHTDTDTHVQMMSGDTSVLAPHIKKEVEQNTFQACSPSNSEMYSPTTTVLPQDRFNGQPVPFIIEEQELWKWH
ncbi:Na(+)/H(+) antiporter NhaA 3 [Frankliniella fusca]|uniref:Na(+)/H(+) antiporter NhaA 3 n=1 Tax=Frankliniella fusca TaxID=407009 RepID=A0AAE1H2J3_9NEOP|nr:Na(+)/H(+) antiporter NhaA 3 [Frankliniella fusca]